MTTKAEKSHMDKVAALGCCICRLLGLGETPAQIHHIREGQGMGQRAGHFLVIPLCLEHHTGNNGIHGMGTRRFESAYRTTELRLLDETLELLEKRRELYGTADEIDRLHQVCRNVYEVWAGSEGIPLPETAPEAYLLQLVEQMRDAAKAGLTVAVRRLG